MDIKNIVMLVSGIVIGGAAGVLGTRKYFWDKYQKRYEEDRDALEKYYNKVDEYSRENREEEDDQNASEETNSRPAGRMTPEERAAIKEKLNKNWEGTTNYASMYKGDREEEDPAESEHPEEDEEEIDYDYKTCKYCQWFENGYCNVHNEEVSEKDYCTEYDANSLLVDDNASEEEQIFDEHRKNIDKPPKIISAETYSNLPAHIEQEVLYFYTLDEQVTDENDEPIDEPELLIGDALTKFDFIESKERVIFVMNYATDTCYEIQKVDGFWG